MSREAEPGDTSVNARTVWCKAPVLRMTPRVSRRVGLVYCQTVITRSNTGATIHDFHEYEWWIVGSELLYLAVPYIILVSARKVRLRWYCS